MARPRKQTVDYFPHTCTHGEVLFIVEAKFGNDGYALWFKLRELLGTAEGHALRLNNENTWEFFQSRARLNEEKCIEILNLFAKLNAIDRDLWSKDRVVWSDNFISDIADVYRNRKVEIPKKPDFYDGKPIPPIESTPENPQRRVKETRVERGEEKTPTSTSKVERIALEKASRAWGEFEAIVLNPPTDKFVIDDEISRKVFFDLGGLEILQTRIAENGGLLRDVFIARYAARDVADFKQRRPV